MGVEHADTQSSQVMTVGLGTLSLMGVSLHPSNLRTQC